MKTAEQIAETLWQKHTVSDCMRELDFYEALREYGELVRQRAADLTFKRTGYVADAAAIERMELP